MLDITSADSIIEFAKQLKNQTLRQACGSEIEKHGYKVISSNTYISNMLSNI